MLQLVPAVQVRPWTRPVSWAPSIEREALIELGPSTSIEDVARVVIFTAAYGDDMPTSARDAADRIIDGDCTIVSGGLIARAPSFEITPGCCCGLESWDEWRGLKPGSQSPWYGHDPEQGVDCGPEHATIVRRGLYPAELSVSYEELAKAVAGAEADLRGLLDPLRIWAVETGVSPSALADGFAEAFRIPV